METTLFLTRILGPVLVLRAISILLDRDHFRQMMTGLEKESATVSFSLFPVAMMVSSLALLLIHQDRSSFAAFLILLIAWGALLKSSFLVLFPRLLARKAVLLEKAGFLWVVLGMTFFVGAYFCWFGFASAGR